MITDVCKSDTLKVIKRDGKRVPFNEDKIGLAKTKWVSPLVSSNVQSGNIDNGDGSDGRPKKDDSEIGSDGVATRDKK